MDYRAHAIIGMNYGDEGKGQFTNFLSGPETLNIRFNGGAQAAHTVVLNDGTEHVFHHFGSGSLKGARTLLGASFIVNPLVFIREFETLSKLRHGWREVLIDPLCRVTTPYDMLLNEFDADFHKKRDTCGLGIYETIERSAYRQLAITARDIINKSESELLRILEMIENEYIPFRLEKLQLPKDAFKTFAEPRLLANDFNRRFVEFSKKMMAGSAVFPEGDVVDRFLAKNPKNNLVFEGAQGLLLSKDRKESWPYITPSNTGLKNVATLFGKLKKKPELEVVLATRSYLSRHGDGPIMNACDRPYLKCCDPSNPENPFQGKIRYGFLDTAWYNRALSETKNDLTAKGITGKMVVGMSCIDQLDKYAAEDPLSSVVMVNEKPLPIREAFGEIQIISTGRKENNVRRI